MTMLTPLFRLFGALRRDTRAVALIEFAVVAPTLILLYLGSFVITDMISCNRKVTIAARELTDMSTRYAPTLPAATADNILLAAQQVMVPYSYNNATIWLTQVQVVDATHVKVVWSEAITNGGTPGAATDSQHLAGTTMTVQAGVIPPNLIPTGTGSGTYCTHANNPGNNTYWNTANGNPAGCLMLGEVKYTYTPVVAGGYWSSTPLYDSIFMQPRDSSGAPQQS